MDIDQWGRIFCPESPGSDGVELSGIIFVAESRPKAEPRDRDWDDLRLQFTPAVEDPQGDGHQLLDQFIERCNSFEWERLRSRPGTKHVFFSSSCPLFSP